MADSPNPAGQAIGAASTIVVQLPAPRPWSTWTTRILLALLGLSVLANISMYSSFQEYFQAQTPPAESYHSGSKTSRDKLVILSMTGTIMPPFTERLIKQIDKALEDDAVKGILLSIDSGGGFVADSHQIYARLKKLSEKKPVFVQMKRMAASGGYYIAMGAGTQGKIFAEPTTWTGSIGVIIPRYDVSELASKLGVASDPLKTGEFKDALSPFHPLTENEKKLWENILNQSFDQFLTVIDDNRDTLTMEQVRKLATGEVFTAKDAKQNGLIDEIGFEEEALAALQKQLVLADARVVTYHSQTGLIDLIVGSVQTRSAPAGFEPWQMLLESSVPRAYYLCSWWPALPQP